jgi:MFS transporter, GlpU family, inner membrane protein
MLGLVLAGEAVYTLPFHVARFFKPTVLEVFSLTPTQLGIAQGVYGIVAMLAYFPGGPLADRYPARKLLALSLWATAAGGLYMATMPDYRGAVLLWGFFGITTILLFWAALIRATRDWGEHDQQGLAYGLLEGGRGVLAAGLASAGALLFEFSFPDGYGVASFAEKQAVLRIIIYGYTAVTAVCGVFVWFALADGRRQGQAGRADWQPQSESVRTHVFRVLRIPAVWLQAVIIICAYVAYKGFDNYSLFAVQGYGLDEVRAYRIISISAWMRPIAAICVGLFADRYTASRMSILAFAILLGSDLYFAVGTPIPGAAWLFLGNTLVACAGFFGLRGLYYALLEEANVPPAVTGTAVGFVSVIGYTPEVFTNYAAGAFIEGAPGLAGYQHFFWFLAAFSLVGVVVSYALMRRLHPAATGSDIP